MATMLSNNLWKEKLPPFSEDASYDRPGLVRHPTHESEFSGWPDYCSAVLRIPRSVKVAALIEAGLIRLRGFSCRH